MSSTDPDIQVTADTTRVELEEPWQVDYWTDTFGVTEAQLRQAVDEVGTEVTDVRRFLGRQASAEADD